MKKLCLLVGTWLSFITMASAATNPDDIVGVWETANHKAHIQIYKEGNKYFGKMIWLKEPNTPKGTPKLDDHNPDPALKGKPIMGLVLLRNFTYDDGEWSGGHIYDPEGGKLYKSYMKLKDAKTLSLRGYIGVSLFGRTEVWTRVK